MTGAHGRTHHVAGSSIHYDRTPSLTIPRCLTPSCIPGCTLQVRAHSLAIATAESRPHCPVRAALVRACHVLPNFAPNSGTTLQLSPFSQSASAHSIHPHCVPNLFAFRNPSTPSVCFTLSPTRLTLRDALLQLPLAPARARYHPGLARQLRPPGPLHQVTTLTSSPTGSSHGPVSRICLIPAPHTDRSGHICLPRPAP